MTRCRGHVFVSVSSKTANHVLVGLLHSAQSTLQLTAVTLQRRVAELHNSTRCPRVMHRQQMAVKQLNSHQQQQELLLNVSSLISSHELNYSPFFDYYLLAFTTSSSQHVIFNRTKKYTNTDMKAGNLVYESLPHQKTH